MVIRILRSTPDAGNAEYSAATLNVAVWTVDSSPSVAAAYLNAPAKILGIPNRFFNLLLRVSISAHLLPRLLQIDRSSTVWRRSAASTIAA